MGSQGRLPRGLPGDGAAVRAEPGTPGRAGAARRGGSAASTALGARTAGRVGRCSGTPCGRAGASGRRCSGSARRGPGRRCRAGLAVGGPVLRSLPAVSGGVRVPEAEARPWGAAAAARLVAGPRAGGHRCRHRAERSCPLQARRAGLGWPRRHQPEPPGWPCGTEAPPHICAVGICIFSQAPQSLQNTPCRGWW